MAQVTRVARDLKAPADQVYAALADYKGIHARILPKPPFVALKVLQGGRGAGTLLDVEVRAIGGNQVLRMAVTEPEPGRVLQEAAADGTVTRFLVEPLGPRRCRVTIETTWPDRKLLRNLMVKPVYGKELRNLAVALALG